MSACPLGVFNTGELHPQRRRELAARFKDGKDLFCIVIVRHMWLTGFDAPACTNQ
jgi:type I site-specific restriction-modification system R (restriction) subunit